MKTLFGALFAAVLCTNAFAGDCEKCKEKDKDKGTVAFGDCEKCKEKDKDKGTVAFGDCEKCKEKDKDKGTIA